MAARNRYHYYPSHAELYGSYRYDLPPTHQEMLGRSGPRDFYGSYYMHREKVMDRRSRAERKDIDHVPDPSLGSPTSAIACALPRHCGTADRVRLKDVPDRPHVGNVHHMLGTGAVAIGNVHCHGLAALAGAHVISESPAHPPVWIRIAAGCQSLNHWRNSLITAILVTQRIRVSHVLPGLYLIVAMVCTHTRTHYPLTNNK